MAKIELPKLKGLYDLSNKDYQVWLNQQFESGTLNKQSSFELADRLYKDLQFKQNFGEELFGTMSASQRDAYYDTYAQELINARYGDSEELKTLVSPLAQRYLLENGYLTLKEREALDAADKLKMEKLIKDTKEIKKNLIFINPRVSPFEMDYEIEEGHQVAYANKIAKRNKENEKIFSKAKELDNDIILQNDKVQYNKQQLIEYYTKQINTTENGALDIDKEITDFLNTKIEGQPLFNYYNTYKDKQELENFNLQDKLDLYTDWQAILQEASKIDDENTRNLYIIKAADIINEKLLNKVHDNRTFWKRAGINLAKLWNYTIVGVGESIASHIANKLYIEGVLNNDLTAYYNFLLGKDKNGGTINKWINMSFLSDVATYNTTDTAEILKAKLNGGLSPMQHVSEYGAEYDFWTNETWGEGFAMLGHQIPLIAADVLLTKGKGTLSKIGTRTLLRTLPRNAVKEITKVTSSNLAKFLGDAARVYVHASPEAAMEGKSNFDIVYDEVIQKQNEFLTSEEGLLAIEQEVQKRFDKLYPGGLHDSSIAVLDENNQWVYLSTLKEKEAEIKETIRQDVIRDIKQNFENTALEAAGKAYQSTYYSFLLKNSVTDLAFLSYTFAGRTPFSGTRNSKLKFDKSGTAKAHLTNAWNITKAVAKPSIGGFIEESTDEMANQGSQLLGLNYANNYIQHLYQGNLEPYIEENIGAGYAYIQGAANALYDKSTWHLAFTGAISPFTNFLPNVGGMVAKNKMSKELWDLLSAVEKINTFIFNPLVSNLATEYQEERQAKELAEFYNKTVEKYGDNLKSVVQTFNLLDLLEKGKLSDDPRQQKDAEHKLGFNFVSTLYQLAQLHDNDNLATLYLLTVERLAKGDITANELAEFKEKVENRGKYDGEEGNTEASKVIQSNAKKLQLLFKDYKATRTMLENAYGSTISLEAIEELTYMSLLTPHWLNRKKQMELDLGISSSKTTTRGRKTRRGIEREIELLKKNIEAADKAVANTTTKKKSLKKIKLDLQKRLKIAEEESKKGTPVQALTADEILNASAIERQNMFENKLDYSVEQLEFIEEAEQILQLKDPDWRAKIKDIAELENGIEQNKELFNALSQNPQDLENYINYMHSTYLNRLLTSYTNQHVDELETQLDLLEVGSSEWHSIINKYGKNVISALKALYEKEGKMTDALRKALNKAEKLSGLLSDIHNIIQQSLLPKEVKKNLIENILAIINDASSYSKAVNSLLNAFENPDIAEDVKSYIRTILEKVGAVEKQRKATKNKNKTLEVEVVEEQEIPLNDDSSKDSQEFVLTKTEDIDLEEQGSVEEELPENDKEPEITNASLENFTLFGNSTLGYMLHKLKLGILNFTRGERENDLKSTYFKWLERINVFPQRVVDYELSTLKALNVPVLAVLLKLPTEGVNSPMNEVALKMVLLVVKADDKVKKIHNNALSDYIIIKGELYLVIGNMGYKKDNKELESVFNKLKDNAKIARKEYFDKEENKNEEFFLIPDYTLSIGNITPGHLIHQTENDTLKKQRSVSELLNDSQRNPRQIGWDDLIWIIPTETGFKANKNVAIAEGEMPGKVGHLFLAIKDPGGKYIPVLMKSYVSEDIKEGAFKNKILQQINNILDGIAERDHDKRLTAVKELSKYLLFSLNGDNILIGTDQNHTISVKVDGMLYDFTEQDIANNRQLVIDRILGNKDKSIPGKFRIVYTGSTITSIDKMKELDEAGVLTTDVAVLGTAGGQFSVVNGTPTQEESSNENQESSNNKFEYSKKESVLLNGKIYRFTDDRYVDENGQTIIDLDTLDKINIVNQCGQMEASLVERGSSYYVLNNDINNLKVVAISGKSNNLRICSLQESLAVIHKIEEKTMSKNIEVSSEDIEIDILNETKLQNISQNNLDNKEKINEPTKKGDVFDKNFGKDLHNSKNNYTFAEISRNPLYRSKIYTLLKDKFGEGYTKATDKETFLKSKGITTTSIQDVEAWMEHIKNCK